MAIRAVSRGNWIMKKDSARPNGRAKEHHCRQDARSNLFKLPVLSL
jgi:hypothetical protein